ncbi:MAG TPA: ABC transporter permease, partial [Planctomycetaceae bacterium]|nr:ABC transporter permease [Planctomycetaceae bacterium]
MRPYLAVLKDSFREALASRVLWIVFILTTVVLALLAPLGIKEEKVHQLRRNSIRNARDLVAKIDQQRRSDEPSPGKQIWTFLSEDLKSRFAKLDEQSPDPSSEMVSQLVNELNGLLRARTLYDAAAWQNVELNDQARQLLKRRGETSLSEDELRRLNELLLEAAYPDELPQKENVEIFVSYLGFKQFGPIPFARSQVTALVKTVLTVIVNWFVGVFAVFAAILVTASIIPQMFEAGAIDLLLSKPVSRSLLFLTKFLGGCAFIGVIAAYFVTGIWMIAGLRFDIWSHKLFLCVPAMLFLFAILYSVSALAGVLWRNAIVSVIVTIVFWGLCFSVGAAKSFIEQLWINPQRLVKIVPARSTLLAVTAAGDVNEWQPADSAWDAVFGSGALQPQGPAGMFLPPMIGPVFDSSRDRILAIPSPLPSGGFNLFGPAAPLAVGEKAGGWVRKKGPSAPPGTLALFARPSGEVVAVGKAAIYRLAAKREEVKAEENKEKFARSGPESALRLDASAAAAMNPDTGAIAIFNRGSLLVLELEESGKYVRKIEKDVVPAKEGLTAVVAFGGDAVLLALDDGRVMIFHAADLSRQHEYRPAGKNPPRFAAASPGGAWLSVLFHTRRLWLYDVRNSRAADISFTGQGDISAAAFDGPNRLLAADRGTRVTQYQLEPFQIEDRKT